MSITITLNNKKNMEAKVWNHGGWITETDPDKLRNNFSDLLALANFEVLNFLEHYFPVQGYTAIWLLGESHFALHTFPEQGKTYIELTSCNEQKHIFFVENIPT